MKHGRTWRRAAGLLLFCGVAALFARLLMHRTPSDPLRRARAIVGDRRPAPESLSVVLITLDTLRADVLGCYGGSVATPAIDRLAAEGVVFEQATATVPLTIPRTPRS